MTWFEHDLSKVIEQISIGVTVTLPHGVIAYANLKLRQWLGLSVEGVLKANNAQFKSGMQIMNGHAARSGFVRWFQTMPTA